MKGGGTATLLPETKGFFFGRPINDLECTSLGTNGRRNNSSHNSCQPQRIRMKEIPHGYCKKEGWPLYLPGIEELLSISILAKAMLAA
jgi:hypothetical protein